MTICEHLVSIGEITDLPVACDRAADLALRGALGGIRTPNLLIRSQMLYPLATSARLLCGEQSTGRRPPRHIVVPEGSSRGPAGPGAVQLTGWDGPAAPRLGRRGERRTRAEAPGFEPGMGINPNRISSAAP